jgi:hypothetical protein
MPVGFPLTSGFCVLTDDSISVVGIRRVVYEEMKRYMKALLLLCPYAIIVCSPHQQSTRATQPRLT